MIYEPNPGRAIRFTILLALTFVLTFGRAASGAVGYGGGVVVPGAVTAQGIAAAGGVTNLLINGLGTLPNPYALFWADSISPTNNAPLNQINDLSGNSHHLTNMSGVTWSQNAVNGHPAFNINGVITNIGFFTSACDTNSTVTVVFVGPQSSSGTLIASGSTDDNFQFYPGAQSTQSTPLIALGRLQNEQDFFWPYIYGVPSVVCMTVANTNFTAIQNERFEARAIGVSYQVGGGTITNWGFTSGNLYLGNGVNKSRPCPAYLAYLRVDQPALTIAQQMTLSKQLDDYYQPRAGDILLTGESQIYGQGGTTPAYSFQTLLKALNPDFTVENQAFGGLSSSNDTNQFMQVSSSRAGKNILFYHQGTGNGAESFGVLTNNLVQMINMAHSNNMLCIPITTIDSWQDANSWWLTESNYQSYITNNWRAIGADGVVDLSQDAVLGASNSWKNLTYRANDGIGHLNDVGRWYMVTNFMQPVLQSVLSGRSGIYPHQQGTNIIWSSVLP